MIRQFFLFLLLLVFLCSCSKSTALKSKPVEVGPQMQLDQSPSVARSGCPTKPAAAFQQDPNPAILPNGGEVTILFTVTASAGCASGYRFTLENETASSPFERTFNFSKTYRVAGQQVIRGLLHSLDTNGEIVSTASVSHSFVIGAGAPDLSCNITKVGPIPGTDDPFPFIMRGTGAIERATFNGLPIVLGQISLLSPGSPGFYSGVGEVVAPNGNRANCSITVFAPRATLTVDSVTETQAVIKIALSGPVGEAFIDGAPLNLPPPPQNTILYTKTPPSPGRHTSVVTVRNTETGDVGIHEISYCLPLVLRELSERLGPSSHPPAPDAQGRELFAGFYFNGSTTAIWYRDFNLQLKGTRTWTAIGQCENGFVTRLSNWYRKDLPNPELICTSFNENLGAPIHLENIHSITGYGYVGVPSTLKCPIGHVILGWSYTTGVPAVHTFKCGKPVVASVCN